MDNTEKRKFYILSEEQLDAIAERGAHAALEKMTTKVFVFVGKGIIERAFWIAGAASLGFYFWLKSRDII